MRFAVLLLLLATITSATQLALVVVKQPLYLHGSDTDSAIQLVDVPVAYATSHPESYFAAIHLPFVPATNGSWREPADINMASVYGLRVSCVEMRGSPLREWRITVDATAAKRPEGYPFTVDQVIDATVTCIKVMAPPVPESERKVILEILRPER